MSRIVTARKVGMMTAQGVNNNNELLRISKDYANGVLKECFVVPLENIYKADVLVPQYYDMGLQKPFNALLKRYKLKSISLGQLIDDGIIIISGGHGSPSNDLRNGTVPYVKVSDIRNMRINVNPTNLVPIELAKRFWKTKDGRSNLREWDLISPSRASSNIGEFAILLPGEEDVVLTKEVFVIRVNDNKIGYSPFYLLWALSLTEVRKQWSRVTLMQTNREDVGNRYREVEVPIPESEAWAKKVSKPFRDYFTGIADAKSNFVKSTSKDAFDYIASVSAFDK